MTAGGSSRGGPREHTVRGNESFRAEEGGAGASIVEERKRGRSTLACECGNNTRACRHPQDERTIHRRWAVPKTTRSTRAIITFHFPRHTNPDLTSSGRPFPLLVPVARPPASSLSTRNSSAAESRHAAASSLRAARSESSFDCLVLLYSTRTGRKKLAATAVKATSESVAEKMARLTECKGTRVQGDSQT